MNTIDTAKAVFKTEIEGLEQVSAALDASFEKACECLLECVKRGGKIVLTGVGKNVYIGEKAAATLSSTGSPAVFLNPVQAMHGDLGMLAPNDVLVAMSYSGESDEIKNLLPAVHRLGNRVIGMTAVMTSTLAVLSDVALSVAVEKEACTFGMVPTTSTTATLALCDAIAMVLVEARGFTREDFALYHPAGAIGKALLTKVSDIMRTGGDVAVVRPGSTVKDAIFAMTRAKAGSCVIVDENRTLHGIFTDGDFRRYLATASGEAPLGAPLDGRATKNPLRVKASQLAVAALRVFETHKIDDLPVTDDDGLFAGLVDIQDLPKFKVM